MSEEDIKTDTPLPYTSAIRWLGFGGGALAILCVLSGVIMLLMKSAEKEVPALMSQIPLVLLPVAFMLLMAAIYLAVRRRRAS